jgi:hypothetical protein
MRSTRLETIQQFVAKITKVREALNTFQRIRTIRRSLCNSSTHLEKPAKTTHFQSRSRARVALPSALLVRCYLPTVLMRYLRSEMGAANANLKRKEKGNLSIFDTTLGPKLPIVDEHIDQKSTSGVATNTLPHLHTHHGTMHAEKRAIYKRRGRKRASRLSRICFRFQISILARGPLE